MPDEKTCPLVAAYVAFVKKQHGGPLEALYVSEMGELDDVLEYTKHQPTDRETQVLRAFYCLNELMTLTSPEGGGVPDLTWGGINDLLDKVAEARDDAKVSVVAAQLDPSLRGQPVEWRTRAGRTTSALCDVITEAAEYLRPRLRNGKPVGHMGALLAKGADIVHMPLSRVRQQAHEIANVTIDTIPRKLQP